jgi:aminoglycoside phosphotransferase (APT) family kinase protein
MSESSPSSLLLVRVARRLGRTIAAVRTVPGGYSAAERFVVRWREGGSAFVKAATDPDTATWLRAEHAIYARIRAPFLPALLGWEDDGTNPWLAIEDLSAAAWPPPWTPARIDAVLATLRAVAATAPGPLESYESRRAEFAGWSRVAEDSGAFLGLGLADERWLAGALPVLLDAETRAVLDGDALVHNDVRSDNLCFADGRVVLVDWNWASRGNPKLDVAAWLPSLELEGGPEPESILPDAPELASLVAGFYAAHAGLPPPRSGMDGLRALQLRMLRASLAWAVRALGLPAPGGLRR